MRIWEVKTPGYTPERYEAWTAKGAARRIRRDAGDVWPNRIDVREVPPDELEAEAEWEAEMEARHDAASY